MQPVTKTCLACRQDVEVSPPKKMGDLERSFLENNEAMCGNCVEANRLNPDAKYLVYAGSIYQKISNVHLKLWPVGSFH